MWSEMNLCIDIARRGIWGCISQHDLTFGPLPRELDNRTTLYSEVTQMLFCSC